jgi:thioredoxin-like negative regulator of GroEL
MKLMLETNQSEAYLLLTEHNTGLIYLYTPLCGTCHTASKMMNVIEQLTEIPIYQLNLNYAPDLAIDLSIESVPCLLAVNNGEILEKVYAFHSVPFIYEQLTKWFYR